MIRAIGGAILDSRIELTNKDGGNMNVVRSEPHQKKRFFRLVKYFLMLVFSRPLHEKMYNLLSSYSDSELIFLLETMTKTIELTHKEAKKIRGLKI